MRSAGDLLTIRPYITAPSRVGTDFTIMTLSTVGFGDISPSPTGDMRTFVAFYALGSGIVFPLLAKLFGDLLTRYSEMVCILYPNPYPCLSFGLLSICSGSCKSVCGSFYPRNICN